MVADSAFPNGGAVGHLPLDAAALVAGTSPDSSQLVPLLARGPSA